MANGIDLILAEHRTVEELFASFRSARDGTAAGMIFDALAAHDDGEQAALYPLVTALGIDAAVIGRSLAAHSGVKRLIEHARNQEGPPLVDAMAALEAAVTDHVKDEERNLLPALQRAATEAQLDGLAARWNQVQQRVG
jgi:hemerythrin superfamily protein